MNLKAEVQMRKDLNATKNIAEAFEVLKKYYQLEKCNPDMFTKAGFISKLSEAMKKLKAEPRKEFQ